MKKMSSSNKVSVDFTGVESGGGRKVPNGEYLLKVSEVELKDSASGNKYLAFKYKVANGPLVGATVWDNSSLAPQALWRLRTLLECFGMPPPEGKLDLDLTKLVGKTVVAEITNEIYQGKEKPRITNFIVGGTESAPASTPSSGGDASFKVGEVVKFNSDGVEFSGKIVGVSGENCRVEVDGDEWEIECSELSR